MSTTRHAPSICALLGLGLLATGCATVDREPITSARDAVREVDFRKAPELKALADHAREFGNETYPKICALFAETGVKPPRQFDLVFKPLKSHNTGESAVEAQRIYMNSASLTNTAESREMFDKVFVHEMAHLVLLSDLPRGARVDFGWEEGLATYAYYKLIGTNGWGCPQCDYRYPHYRTGYTCAGAFLLYVESRFGSNIISQFKVELLKGRDPDAFFARATGKNLVELWADFQTTAAFKPGANEALALSLALGFMGAELPRNALARFNKYVTQHADDFVKQAVKSANLDGKGVRDVRSLMAVYLYFTQPGGSAEKAWMDVREKDGAPGIVQGEHGALAAFLRYDEIASQNYPVTRTLNVTKRGDSSSVYCYTMSRDSAASGWKLTKAWRAGADGRVTEEFPVPQ